MNHEADKLAIYLTNLGKYNEGELIGKWVTLPTDSELLEKAFQQIEIGEEYEEYFISDYESPLGIKVG
ncbi:antirestriction protein ArdA [Listeria monocytogenes]|nr:antirestriction protein ArdA [Listeria monocytogenes]